MRRTIFSQTAVLCGMFLPLFLAVAANNLFAEDYDDITVNGVNDEKITIGDGEGANDTAKSVTVDYDYVGGRYYYGTFYNGRYGGTGTVGTATLKGGVFYNGYRGGTGNVGTATLKGGYFYNGYGVYGGGTGAVGTVTLNGGYFYNGYGGYGGGTGAVGTVTLNGGYFYNGYGYYGGTGIGTVNTATLNGGTFYNGYGYYGGTGIGTVNTATLNGGTFYNGPYGTGNVVAATLNGGTFYNGYGGTGNVEHLIYNGGEYYANINGGTSSLGKLTLGTNVSESQGAEFMKSKPQELAFGQDYGIINITGTVGENGWGFTNDINVSAPTIDLAGTKIDVSVAALLTGDASSDPLAFLFNTYFEDGFSLASLFNGRSTIIGGGAVEDLWFSWGTDADASVSLIAGGVVNSAAGFSWANEARTAIAWTLPETSSGAATPEPATLALFGCGLAGLVALRRRQRK